MKSGIALCVLVLAAACSSKPAGNDRDTMTQRQKDSVFGASGVPGASAITKAQTAADSLNAQRKRADSAAARPDTGSH
jgi:uncharacterized protein YdeI (BOF family)